MASATRKTVEKVVKEVQGVTLELSAEEAEWLRGYVGRSTDLGRFSSAIYSALDAPAEEPADRPIRVGDKVRVVQAAYDPSYNGRIGTIGSIDVQDPDAMYRVEFSGDYDYEWAKTIERVND